MSNVVYGGSTFEIPTLSERNGIYPTPREMEIQVDPKNPLIHDLDTKWDLSRFGVSRHPLKIGMAHLPSTKPQLRILDMPIKMPGSNEYRIPEEIRPFMATIQSMIDAEHRLMDKDALLKYHAYLTVDSDMVEAGKSQRKGGCHVDGFQGARITEKTTINHSYIAMNTSPADFFPQSFNFDGLDESKHDFFLEMDRQAPKPVTMDRDTIYLMDAYTVHRAGVSATNEHRVFIRLSFDVKVFDRLGNTHNPLFDYNWKMVARDVHTTLKRFE